MKRFGGEGHYLAIGPPESRKPCSVENSHHLHVPSGASWLTLTTRGCALPLFNGDRQERGLMATQVTIIAPATKQVSRVLPKTLVPWISTNSQDCTSEPEQGQSPVAYRDVHAYANPESNLTRAIQAECQPFDVSAHSVQFVSAPGQTYKLQSLVPPAIREAFRSKSGFAGCMVMVSDQEARRVTIVTLWKGNGHRRHCAEYAQQLRTILLPYAEHWLRSENHVAHFSTCSSTDQPATV